MEPHDRAPDPFGHDPGGNARLTRSVDDAAAFEPLVEQHSAALHGYFVRRAPHTADDLLAETWAQAFAARRRFDPALGTARGWLFGVARNVLLLHLRRADRSPALAEQETADPWQAVDQRLDAGALVPQLRRALADLPFEERELLLLIAWEQLTPSEAACVVGIPAGTARSRLHRARNRMREQLISSSRSGRLAMSGESA